MVAGERGSALLMVMGAAAIVAIMTAALGSMVLQRQNTVAVGAERARAQAMADAAMAFGLEGLRLDPEHYDGFGSRTWGGGDIACSVAGAVQPDEVWLRAEGASGVHRVVFEARVRVSGPTPRVVEWRRSQGTVR
jgi:hypothetical protein